MFAKFASNFMKMNENDDQAIYENIFDSMESFTTRSENCVYSTRTTV